MYLRKTVRLYQQCWQKNEYVIKTEELLGVIYLLSQVRRWCFPVQTVH